MDISEWQKFATFACNHENKLHDEYNQHNAIATSLNVSELKVASVLIPIWFRSSNSPEVILTVRSASLSTHAGQVCFPGGQRDLSDRDEQATALRELEEEIGISIDKITLSGQLPAFRTISGFQVTPVLGVLRSTVSLGDFMLSEEVSEMFTLPLHSALNMNQYKMRTLIRDNRIINVKYLSFEHYDIWGMTANMLYHLAELYQRYSVGIREDINQ